MGHQSVYIYHLADNAWTMESTERRAVVWQTGMNPVVALGTSCHRCVEQRRRARSEAFPAERSSICCATAREWVIEAGRPEAADAALTNAAAATQHHATLTARSGPAVATSARGRSTSR